MSKFKVLRDSSRRTINRNEGTLAVWKKNLLDEIQDFELNLDKLFEVVGISTHSIVEKRSLNGMEGSSLSNKGTDREYTKQLDKHYDRLQRAANNICNLINVQTEFALPIPIHVLLRLAYKCTSLRWNDYNKKPNGLHREYVYSMSPKVIETGLTVIKSVVIVLGTNIIPLVAYVNQIILNALEWTRNSNLDKHSGDTYFSTRIKLLDLLTFISEQLSMKMNLNHGSLMKLLDTEILETLQAPNLTGEYFISCMNCIESLVISYGRYLDAQLQHKLKNFIIRQLLSIYRDFDPHRTSPEHRRRLLDVLIVMANQPFSTSTTELTYHILELVVKVEIDRQMRSYASRALNFGLAHRPTIVSSYDVFDNFAFTLPDRPEEVPEDVLMINGKPTEEIAQEESRLDIRQCEQRVVSDNQEQVSKDESKTSNQISASNSDSRKEQSPKQNKEEDEKVESVDDNLDEKQDTRMEDNEIDSYMSHFVEKLAE